MVLLDTDPMTVLEREGPEVTLLKARLATVPLDDLGTTIISYEEQTRGWLAYMARMQTEEARIRAYVFLKRHVEIYCRVTIVQYDEKAAAEFARLKQAKIRIGTMDLKIAAIAIANDALLLTRNLADFSKVPKLKAEDWSIYMPFATYIAISLSGISRYWFAFTCRRSDPCRNARLLFPTI